ncbi:putative 23S rRNA (guanosine(2251)-2'-O)-methyltransferase [Microsporum audouinii]
MVLSHRLAVSGTSHLPLKGLLGVQGVSSIRYLSVNSAITTGIRKGREFGEPKRRRAPWDRRGKVSPKFQRPEKESHGNDAPAESRRPPVWSRDGAHDTYGTNSTVPGRTDQLSRDKPNGKGFDWAPRRKPPTYIDNGGLRKLEARGVLSERQQMGGYAKTEDEVKDVHHPLSSKIYLVPPPQIPYASPVSEFIYGTSAVNAAVRCGRRKLHTLYLFEESSRYRSGEPKWEQPEVRSIAKYASLAGAQVKHVTGPWKNTLDKMTGKRPHNGMVLEASPLPKPPVLNFQTVVSMSNSHFLAQLAPQPDEQAAVNGTDGYIPFEARRKGAKASRYPFTLLLDGILDPGNLGAIFRSAHWFGADAIAFSPLNSAPISPVVMKAAAGATETVPTLAIRDVTTFITASQANGWKFFAADAPEATLTNDYTRKIPVVKSLSSLSTELTKAPCVLMLGGEGSGLQQKIKNRADAFVTIPGAYSDNICDDIAGVSSLNVSVASALLCEAFLSRPPSGATEAQVSSDVAAGDMNRIF